VHGILFDLGIASMQLAQAERGFSFQTEAPLDMRFSESQSVSAADIVNDFREEDLANLIWEFGEERFSRRIARAIVQARPLSTTTQLANIISRSQPDRHSRIHPATRTFQALRIWVNHELEGLDRFLETLAGRLGAGARLAVITFHSLEDRIVKHTLRALERQGRRLSVLTRKPIVPTAAEVERNPRARSAKLRAAEKVA
jgi:16S rRNA (cytosine1402-N4)-methyltransferase